MNTTHTPCRYEITNREDGISITSPDGIVDQLIASDPEDGQCLDDAVIGAIRQQSRDLELLTNMLHDQRLVIDDLEHRRVKVCDENDQLRADLAAAVADVLECREHLRVTESALRVTRDQRDTLRARLAAIDGAPTVALACGDNWCSFLLWDCAPELRPSAGAELIARPAKD